MTEINKEEWDKWVESCPVCELQNAWTERSLGMVFDNPKSFKKWLKNIPLFRKEIESNKSNKQIKPT